MIRNTNISSLFTRNLFYPLIVIFFTFLLTAWTWTFLRGYDLLLSNQHGDDETLPLALFSKHRREERKDHYKSFQDIWETKDILNNIITNNPPSQTSKLPHKSNWLVLTKGGAGLGGDHDTSSSNPAEYYIKHRKSSGTLFPGQHNITIPRIIHKIYFQKDGKFDPRAVTLAPLKEAHQSWFDMNPGYEMHYFNLDDARSYLSEYFHPIFIRAFDCLEAFAAKADFFRMVVLYREGGWYSDWKQVVLQNRALDNLAIGSGTFDFVAAWDQGNQVSVRHKCIQNALVGATPQHPIIEETLVRILKNIQSTYYGQTALHSSSCCVFGDAWRMVVSRNGDILQHIKMGNFSQDHFIFDNNKDNPIVQHKCNGCGTGQNWIFGNNYNVLHKSKKYYCEDAPSIFNVPLLKAQL